jgi:hypothetical protein
MKATRSLLAAMVLGTAIGASQVDAQGCSGATSCAGTNTAQVVVPALVKLVMPSNTTTLTAPSADQIDLGATVGPDAGPTFTIKANRSWTLNIQSGVATNWNYTGSFAGVKPIADLLWSNAVAGSYVAITGSAVLFTSGGAATNGASAQPFFKTVWASGFTNVANEPGTYTLPVTFTLTAP